MDIWRIAEILNRRKWLIALSMIVSVVLAFGATRLTGSRWMATVRFLSPDTSSVAPGGEARNHDSGRPVSGDERDTLESMYSSIITSREVVAPAFRKISEPVPGGKALSDMVEFSVTGPRLFELNVSSNNPTKVEQIANALAESFVERNHELNTQQSAKTVRLLETQLQQADKELASARNKYRAYSAQHKLLGNPDEEGKASFAEIEVTRRMCSQVRQDLAAVQARLNDAKHRAGLLAPQMAQPRLVRTGPSAKSLADELDRIVAKMATVQARYGEEHPEVKEVVAAHGQVQTRLKAAQKAEAAIAKYEETASQYQALQKSIADLSPRVAELQAQYNTLNSVIGEAETRTRRARELGDPFGSLSSEVAARVQARDGLANRLNTAQLALDIAQRQNPIVIMSRVDELNAPVNVTAGRNMKVLIIAALAALIGTSGILIALDSLDRRVKSVREAELLLPARVLATIPQPTTPVSYSSLARVVELEPRSLVAEAYRFLGLHLLSVAGPEARSLMVLSAKAEQGSTTTIVNLAITLAQAGHRVILADANTRTPELHHVFQTENQFGFTELLMDPTASSFEKALQPTTVSNLRIITSGTPPQNPWELFRSENLTAVSDKLRNMADYVLYDTPSGVVFTDALNLAPVVDAAFLCIRALEAPTGVEQRLLELVDQADVKVLGAVLSHVPTSMVAGYENYQNYYAPALYALPATPPTEREGSGMEAHANRAEDTNSLVGVGVDSPAMQNVPFIDLAPRDLPQPKDRLKDTPDGKKG